MKAHSIFHVIVLLLLFIFVALFSSVTFASGQADCIGIVLLHGKTGQPQAVGTGVVEPLRQAGFLVEVPEMPWSRNRYIDKTYEEALSEIDQAAAKLKAQGATKVIIAGHSMGGDAALAYGAYHGNIAGVILLAPGHIPDFPSAQREYASGVAKAKAMIDAGRGNDIATFPDSNMGKDYIRTMRASIYYSFFDPEGMGAAAKNASMLNQDIPVLYVGGTNDFQTKKMGKEYIFNKLPTNPMTKYVVVDANHLGTPAAAVAEMIKWLNTLMLPI